jgi:thymidine kinase
MFSGKTTELLKQAKKYSHIKKVLLINYLEDNRYSTTEVKTHDLYSVNIPTIFTSNLMDNLENCKSNYDVICINEAQFFDNLRNFIESLLNHSKILYVSGLDGDFKQQPFGQILDIIPLCNTVSKLSAFCKICNNGKLAHFTKRTINSDEQKLIGSGEYYTPVCREHLS